MEKVTLINVVDGDTFVAEYHKIPIFIRLAYIDCLERKSFRKDTTYSSAKNLITKLLEDNKDNIFINFLGIDKYRRHIAEVFINEKNIALELLENGFAYYSIKYFEPKEDYSKAENQARNKKIGIWKNE